MKHLLVVSFFITTNAFSYHSTTVGNHPVRLPTLDLQKREVASVQIKEDKQEKTMKEREKK